MDYTGERVVPWNPESGIILHHHVERYAWAMQFVAGKTVADLGCGCGYGSYMLSWIAQSVVGVDIDLETIRFCKEHFHAENLRFQAGDVEGWLPDAQVYVLFEVLEHTRDPTALLECIEGTSLWSLPILDDSMFHRHLYSVKRAETMGNGGIWCQSADGLIVPRAKTDFRPKYVLGVRE